MLFIGFTKKYYTLWDVIATTTYDGDGRPTEKVIYTYLQNLSTDERKAIEKAKEMGVENLIPDSDLYGRNKSWVRERKLYSELPNNISPWFGYGKYKGDLISESNDLDYLLWYYNDCHNIPALKILLKNNILIEFDGKILSPKVVESMAFEKRMLDVTSVEVFFDKNLSDNVPVDGGVGYGIFDDGNTFEFLFPDVKPMSYNGYTYCLPMIGGKAKRIKNKKLHVVGEVVNGEYGSYFRVDKFKILN